MAEAEVDRARGPRTSPRRLVDSRRAGGLPRSVGVPIELERRGGAVSPAPTQGLTGDVLEPPWLDRPIGWSNDSVDSSVDEQKRTVNAAAARPRVRPTQKGRSMNQSRPRLAEWLRLAASCAPPHASQAPPAPSKPGWQLTAHGVLVTPANGAARTLRLVVMSPSVVRVTAWPHHSLLLPDSLMVVASPEATAFTVSQSARILRVSTAKLRAEISLDHGTVRVFDAAGELRLSAVDSGHFDPAGADRPEYFHVRQQFNRGTSEGLYGLGAHQTGQFDYQGADVELAQHNVVAAVPFLVSTGNYGILWDNNGLSRFGVPHAYRPLAERLEMFDAEGKPGGLTGRYYRGTSEVLVRTESDPDYQYLPADQFLREPPSRGAWPAELDLQPPSRVTWRGTLEARVAGLHQFQLYASGYYKVWLDGELVLDRWRQSWNPWYHALQLQMRPGERHSIAVEWHPRDGYFRLLHRDPLPEAQRREIQLSSEAARAIDYYVVIGGSLDEVIAGYRHLTGPAVLLPRWAYGFWQSRQRYETQEELLQVVGEYRRRRIPFDNIVLDWCYWPQEAWGSHEFDSARFPDPAGMVQQVHDSQAQIMISVWPKFYPSTANYQELDAAGHIYRRQIEMRSRDWVGPGYPNAFYDSYSADARRIYWRQIQEKLGVLGFDAWWTDASEPDSHGNLDTMERALRMSPNALGSGAEYFNSYVLQHARAIFEGERSCKPDVRTFQLTRSAWGGMQRYGAANWSGDVTARWDDLALQIPAGLNFSLSGLPNWTHDIGGFSLDPRFSSADPADRAQWQELYLRWFQFGTFSPIFRAHGEFPHRETYEVAEEGSEIYESLLYHHHLRYRLLPYIYTLAAGTYHEGGTIMRALVMDFPGDPRVRNIGDEYSFGPSLLVAPVTTYGARTRSVYLPRGATWYDFRTGAVFEGGQSIEAEAPLSHLPLFVRAGAILPLGPEVQFASENLAGPVTLVVFTGSDGAFSLYEDDGVTYAHQRGDFSRIPLRYEEANGTLTIDARRGSFDGMPRERTFHVRFVSGPGAGVGKLDAEPDHSLRYTGEKLSVLRQ